MSSKRDPVAARAAKKTKAQTFKAAAAKRHKFPELGGKTLTQALGEGVFEAGDPEQFIKIGAELVQVPTLSKAGATVRGRPSFTNRPMTPVMSSNVMGRAVRGNNLYVQFHGNKGKIYKYTMPSPDAALEAFEAMVEQSPGGWVWDNLRGKVKGPVFGKPNKLTPGGTSASIVPYDKLTFSRVKTILGKIPNYEELSEKWKEFKMAVKAEGPDGPTSREPFKFSEIESFQKKLQSQLKDREKKFKELQKMFKKQGVKSIYSKLPKRDLVEDTEEGRWVTIKGTHVFIKKGQSPMEALEETIGKKKVKKEERVKKEKELTSELAEIRLKREKKEKEFKEMTKREQEIKFIDISEKKGYLKNRLKGVKEGSKEEIKILGWLDDLRMKKEWLTKLAESQKDFDSEDKAYTDEVMAYHNCEEHDIEKACKKLKNHEKDYADILIDNIQSKEEGLDLIVKNTPKIQGLELVYDAFGRSTNKQLRTNWKKKIHKGRSKIKIKEAKIEAKKETPKEVPKEEIEEKEEMKDLIWRSTKSGLHFPIKEGQSKSEALKEKLGEVKKGKSHKDKAKKTEGKIKDVKKKLKTAKKLMKKHEKKDNPFSKMQYKDAKKLRNIHIEQLHKLTGKRLKQRVKSIGEKDLTLIHNTSNEKPSILRIENDFVPFTRVNDSMLGGYITRDGPFLYEKEVKYKEWKNIKDIYGNTTHMIAYGSKTADSHTERNDRMIGYFDNFVLVPKGEKGPYPDKDGNYIDNRFNRVATQLHTNKDAVDLSDLDKEDLIHLPVSASYDDIGKGNLQHISKLRHGAVSLNKNEMDRCSTLNGSSCNMSLISDFIEVLNETEQGSVIENDPIIESSEVLQN